MKKKKSPQKGKKVEKPKDKKKPKSAPKSKTKKPGKKPVAQKPKVTPAKKPRPPAKKAPAKAAPKKPLKKQKTTGLKASPKLKSKSSIDIKIDKAKEAKTAKLKKVVPPAPVLKVFLCGFQSVYWLPCSINIPKEHWDTHLHPDEIQFAESQYKKKQRQDEFKRARWLFRKATKTAEPLLPDADGVPQFSEKFVGSMSHKDGHVIVSACSRSGHYAAGIDLERVENDKILPRICSASEIEHFDRLNALYRMTKPEFTALMFSFKESIFKCYFPLGRQVFSFLDVQIEDIDMEKHEITARALKDLAPQKKNDDTIVGAFSWIEEGGVKYVITTCEERIPILIHTPDEPSAPEAKDEEEIKSSRSQKKILDDDDEDESEQLEGEVQEEEGT